MSEWREYVLKDVIDKFIDYRGKTPVKSDSGVPLITARIIKNGVIETPTEFIPEELYEIHMTRGLPKKNDVLLTVEAPLGEVALVKDERIALAQRIITLRGKKDKLDNIFLKYCLQSHVMQHRLRGRATGTTVQGIKSAELKKIRIDLPSLDEQRRIATVLSTLDAKIDLLRRQNHTLEQIAQTLFKRWFVAFEFPNEQGRPYKSSGGAMQPSELGKIPEGWRVAKLADVIEIRHGFAFKGDFITTEETENILLTPGNFRIGGGFNSSKYKYFQKSDFPDEYLLKKGDLIVTMTDLSKEGDTLGYPAILPKIKGKRLLHNQRLGKVIISKEDILSKYFLYWLLCRREYRAHILGSASGSTVRHTSPTRICDFQFALPPSLHLENFTTTVKPVMNKVLDNYEQIQTLTHLRDTLLPKLMSGQLRVAD